MLSAGDGGQIQVWDAETLELNRSLPGHNPGSILAVTAGTDSMALSGDVDG